jgi:NAD(P)-dependent dehydrogenase (short-subunit alcohol dehydrogenase family)
LFEVALDLNDLSSVSTAAKRLLELPRIDVLLNNAGGLTSKRCLSADGFEQQFQQNHLGHFALTSALMPLLLSSKATVINVSSEAHRAGRINFEDLQAENSYSGFGRYADVKLMNILLTRGLHQRFHSQGLNAFALHPGVVNTSFSEGLGGFKWMWKIMTPFLITPEKGAATSVFLATTAPNEKSGSYFKNKKPSKPSRIALDQPTADRLWEVSEKLIQKG